MASPALARDTGSTASVLVVLLAAAVALVRGFETMIRPNMSTRSPSSSEEEEADADLPSSIVRLPGLSLSFDRLLLLLLLRLAAPDDVTSPPFTVSQLSLPLFRCCSSSIRLYNAVPVRFNSSVPTVLDPPPCDRTESVGGRRRRRSRPPSLSLPPENGGTGSCFRSRSRARSRALPLECSRGGGGPARSR